MGLLQAKEFQVPEFDDDFIPTDPAEYADSVAGSDGVPDDPFAPLEEAKKTPQVTADLTKATSVGVTVTLPTTPWGLGYGSVSHNVVLDTDDAERDLAVVTETIAALLIQNLEATVKSVQASVPTAPAGTSGRAGTGNFQQGSSAPSGGASGTPAEQADQYLNGTAAAPRGGSIFTKVKGEYKDLLILDLDAMSEEEFKAKAKHEMSEAAEILNNYLVAYDNRADLLAGKKSFDKLPGHAGRLALSKNAPEEALKAMATAKGGQKSVAWVDFDAATGKVTVSPTKEFLALNFKVRQVLAAEPAGTF